MLCSLFVCLSLLQVWGEEIDMRASEIEKYREFFCSLGAAGES